MLLAPACASFDQFQSYEHRGEVFKEMVSNWDEVKWPQKLKTDWVLFVTVLCMVTFGMLIVYSASSIMAEMDARYHSTWHFVIRQAAWAVIAIGVHDGAQEHAVYAS